MRISELMTREQGIHRRVGLHIPDGRSAVRVGIDIYQALGIDVIVNENTIYVWVGKVLAPHVQAALERRTGIIAFNDWD